MPVVLSNETWRRVNRAVETVERDASLATDRRRRERRQQRVGGAFFLARITGRMVDPNGGKRWRYSFLEVVLTPPNSDAEKADGRSGDVAGPTYAINLAEMNNPDDGVMGAGYDTTGADWPAGFSVQPTPTNRVVFMTEWRREDGSLVYLFDQDNAADGTCGGGS